MVDLSSPQGKVVVVVLVLVVLGLGYFLWTKSAAPTPTIPAGQSLQNPFGRGNVGPSPGRPGAQGPR